MTEYIIATTLSMALAFVGTHTTQYRNGNRLPFVLLSGFPLFYLAAVRYCVGTDYGRYIQLFKEINVGHKVRDIEFGYQAICKGIGLLGGNGQTSLAVFALIQILFIWLQIFDDSSYPAGSILLFVITTYYFYALNGVRQMAGTAILIYSIRFIKQKKIKPFLICVFFATSIHYSSIVFVIVFWLANIKINVRTITIISAIIAFFRIGFQTIIIQIVEKTPYAHYVEGYDGSIEIQTTVLLIMGCILVLGILLYCDERNFRIYFNMHLIAFWLCLLGNVIPWLYRIQRIFEVPMVITIPMIISQIKNNILRACALLVIIASFVVLTYHRIVVQGYNDCFPYMSIFDSVYYH